VSPELPYRTEILIEQFVVSPIHRYEGRPADGPADLDASIDETPDTISVVAGLGIRGDRFFGRAAHRTAAVTFFAAEALQHVETVLACGPLDPVATRRNIVVRGADIDLLTRQPFSIDTGDGPVHFDGQRPANPCGWMNTVLAPGAHKALRGRGGIRSTPTTSGTLRLGRAILASAIAVPPPAAPGSDALF
jgi:MOSC domain-containing protein YiiM